MKRNLKICFDDETKWATVLEFFRRTCKAATVDTVEFARGDVIAAHAREYLDRPATPQCEEAKP